MLSGILNSAISGVNVNAQRIASAADNVANVATTSYKPNQINAHTLATAQTSTTSYAPGGVLSSPRTLANVQGLLASSTSSTDMAISGQGYFAVSRQPASNVSPSQALYSRDGSFAPDAQGNLVNGSGYYLLAHKPGENGTLSAVNVARVGTSAQASSTISVSSDGATPGGVERVSVSPQGALTATFSNGQTRAIADIPVATFTSPQNLQAVGGNAYQATDASGQPLLGGAGAGQVQGGALELSATDLGAEFASMIVAQSAYSASLKVLAAGEDMARTLLSVRA